MSVLQLRYPSFTTHPPLVLHTLHKTQSGSWCGCLLLLSVLEAKIHIKKVKGLSVCGSCSVVVVFCFSINHLFIFRLITLVSASLAHATAVPRTSAGTAQRHVSALWTLHWNSHLRCAPVYSMLILWIIHAFSFKIDTTASAIKEKKKSCSSGTKCPLRSISSPKTGTLKACLEPPLSSIILCSPATFWRLSLITYKKLSASCTASKQCLDKTNQRTWRNLHWEHVNLCLKFA